jgi:hypothetical protein
MLRAAHTLYIYSRQSDRASRSSPSSPKAQRAVGNKRKGSPRGRARGENQLVGFATQRSPPKSRSRAVLSPSKHTAAHVQAEVWC